jgi:ribonuclease R
MSTLLPGSEATLKDRVLARLREKGKLGVWPLEIRDKLSRGIPVKLVEEALESLQREGQAYEVEGLWYGEDAGVWSVGVVESLDNGDALIRPPGWGKRPESFVRRRNLADAFSADTVLVRKTGRLAGDLRLPEATVVRILNERFQTLVGTIEKDNQGRGWLVPYDPKLPAELPAVGGEDVPEGCFVVVRVERGKVPQARVMEILGNPEEPGVDVKIVLRHYGIPDEFPPAVVAAATSLPEDPGPKDWEGREDLRASVVITVDGESARDFDDAISIERLPDGLFRLGVHIADVAHYVVEGGVLDQEAYRRATSVYYPDRAIPMLPERLSNGLCSLRPHVPRLTTSVFLDIGRDGKVQDRRFAETVIRSSRRMTYNEVRRILEEPKETDAAEYGPVLPCLREMHLLMTILLHSRLKRGSIDFDLPEGNVELGTDGTVVGVTPAERNVAHRLIEEFMIAANEAVAYELDTRAVPALYRAHDAPNPEKLQELREVLKPFGVPLKGELSTLHPAALQHVLNNVKDTPAEAFISSLVLRTMSRAVYDPICRGHYALASHHYCHFTSPIRRYPDLVVHRGLKALIHGEAEKRAADTGLEARLPAMADHSSAMERRAEQSERDLLQWKKVRFLADRVGETFKGRITGVQPFGVFVQLDTYLVDGLVPVRTMGDDFYVYEPDAHRLVGERNRRIFQLADEVEVELTGVNPRRRGLDFKLVGMPEGADKWDRDRPQDRGERKKGERRQGERGAKKEVRRKRR